VLFQNETNGIETTATRPSKPANAAPRIQNRFFRFEVITINVGLGPPLATFKQASATFWGEHYLDAGAF
jgi:hypothetical protein